MRFTGPSGCEADAAAAVAMPQRGPDSALSAPGPLGYLDHRIDDRGGRTVRGDLPMTEFRLLGPVEAWRDERRLTIEGRKPRALLAALLLERGQVVSAETLIDRVWGDFPPDSARTLVQTYVWVLRRALGDVIETKPAGYRIRVASAGTDRDRFAELAAQGAQRPRTADTQRPPRCSPKASTCGVGRRWEGSAGPSPSLRPDWTRNACP